MESQAKTQVVFQAKTQARFFLLNCLPVVHRLDVVLQVGVLVGLVVAALAVADKVPLGAVLGQQVPLEVGRVGRLVAAHLAHAVQYLVVDGLDVVLDEPGPARPVQGGLFARRLGSVDLIWDVTPFCPITRHFVTYFCCCSADFGPHLPTNQLNNNQNMSLSVSPGDWAKWCNIPN